MVYFWNLPKEADMWKICNTFSFPDSLQEQISPNVLPSELSGKGRSLKDEEGIDFSMVSDYFKDLKKYIFNE